MIKISQIPRQKISSYLQPILVQILTPTSPLSPTSAWTPYLRSPSPRNSPRQLTSSKTHSALKALLSSTGDPWSLLRRWRTRSSKDLTSKLTTRGLYRNLTSLSCLVAIYSLKQAWWMLRWTWLLMAKTAKIRKKRILLALVSELERKMARKSSQFCASANDHAVSNCIATASRLDSIALIAAAWAVRTCLSMKTWDWKRLVAL